MFTPQFWETLVQYITQGEPVSPSVTNRPISQLDQNVHYLWQILQAHSIGSALFARAVTVDSSVVVGTPVYFDATNDRFSPALAITKIDSSTGRLELENDARVWGIVYKKHNATLADLLICGYAQVDITPVVDTYQSGIYYLSHVNRGKLTVKNLPLGIPVLLCDGKGKVFVFPQLLDTLGHHNHYKFVLTCLPAGNHTPPSPGDPHVITSPNPSLPGWLPANHPIFNNLAPNGAKFGYNLSQHPELQQQWPPSGDVYLEWNHTDSAIGYTGVPLGQYGLCVIDQNGIWWMTDCYKQVPWPYDYDTSSPPPPPSGPCYTSLMRMNLWFTKWNYASDIQIVKSLKSVDPRLVVRCANTNTTCSTGNLEIDLDLNFVVSNNEQGHIVFKTFNSTTNEFKRGPVVEGVYTKTPTILKISSNDSEVRNINNTNYTVHYGLVGLELDFDFKNELDVQLVRLDSVEEQYFQNITYFGFPKNRTSEVRCKINVPTDINLSNLQLSIILLLLARTVGTTPNLQLTARRIPYPSAPFNLATLPGNAAEFPVSITTSTTTTATNQYYYVQSDPFSISAGDTVFFTIKRTIPDSYNDEFGLIRVIGKLSTA